MDRQQIIDLWKIAFGDSDDFIRLFFDRVYKDEQTHVIQQNGRIVAALQILPYEMTYCGTVIPAGYICGVCTLPSERGKGLMSRLMCQALAEMQHSRYALAILIPASPPLFELYRRFDFANAFDYATEEIQSDNSDYHPNGDFRIVSHEMLSTDKLYNYYLSKQRERNGCILHSSCQFETIRQDRLLGGGEIWVALSNEQPVGLAFTDPLVGKTVSIREIMVENDEIKNVLVQSILNHHQLHRAKLRVPPVPSNANPYGMARIIHKEQMIDLYRTFYNHTPLPDFENQDLPLLTQTLLKYELRQSYMNLMLD